MYSLLRTLLFRLDPETAHHLTLGGLKAAHALGLGGIVAKRPPDDPRAVMGLAFPNPVGLAAGLDKNGDYIDALGALGFGFIEIGTVTPLPQPGNPQPRLFRLPEAQGIINRMGFNNGGVDALVENVKRANYQGILGINIGKNAATPIEKAADDYLVCLRKVYAYASYVTVNISSPNTRNLRQLQGSDELDALLAQLKTEQGKLADEHGKYVPVALKIAPDMEGEQIAQIARLLVRHRIDAVIATNTTLSREGVEHMPHGSETGGLSGAPVRGKSTAVIRALAAELQGALPIIGAGGVMSAADAAEKIGAGAALVQIYSGLIYRGPALIGECCAAIKLKDGNTRLADRIDAILPQTQCGKCGYPGCRPYAEAIAAGEADINKCPPGGEEGIHELAELLGTGFKPFGEGVVLKPPSVAFIDENLCIGCTLCIQACPVDAISGASKLMHTIIAPLCTGCELCVAPCPVDCISMLTLPQAAGNVQPAREGKRAAANAARERYHRRLERVERDKRERAERLAQKEKVAKSAAAPENDAQALIQAALERARTQAAAVKPQNIGQLTAAQQAQIDEIEARRARVHDLARPDNTPSEE